MVWELHVISKCGGNTTYKTAEWKRQINYPNTWLHATLLRLIPYHILLRKITQVYEQS